MATDTNSAVAFKACALLIRSCPFAKLDPHTPFFRHSLPFDMSSNLLICEFYVEIMVAWLLYGANSHCVIMNLNESLI
jgi:hypothetical protein